MEWDGILAIWPEQTEKVNKSEKMPKNENRRPALLLACGSLPSVVGSLHGQRHDHLILLSNKMAFKAIVFCVALCYILRKNQS